MINIKINHLHKEDKVFIAKLKTYFSNRPYNSPLESQEIVRDFIKEKGGDLFVYNEEDIDKFIDEVYNEFIDTRKGEVYVHSIIDKSKHAQGRSVLERNKRRTDDFNKNTLPTLTGFERKHF